MSFCEHCKTVVRHEGTPSGKVEKINGVDTYVALPTIDYPKDKAILFLPDVFGMQLVNAKLIADDFAENGFQVYIPDYLNGDPIPEENPDFGVWFPKHGKAETEEPLKKVIDALKAKGIKEFGATGYCFGARYVFNLAFEGEIKVGVVSHPSLLQVEDLEAFSKTKVPLLINSCETDPQYGADKQEAGDKILASFAPGYKREYWEGCTHGFAVRGDLSDPKVKAGKEGAFKAAVEWFIKYL